MGVLFSYILFNCIFIINFYLFYSFLGGGVLTVHIYILLMCSYDYTNGIVLSQLEACMQYEV